MAGFHAASWTLVSGLLLFWTVLVDLAHGQLVQTYCSNQNTGPDDAQDPIIITVGAVILIIPTILITASKLDTSFNHASTGSPKTQDQSSQKYEYHESDWPPEDGENRVGSSDPYAE
ncbi:Cell wall integrity and stress response component 4 [Coniosporium tulheliwenetii]|uniref:Cell wall integrity and stress response component 4 n=1 Tax=Coniosporium tulheliwenetii TaxID=3383036 RepID=A0ACC2YVN1_9PEZI|nr:Cell wall integrity and stress response component 4 [Cladosporium sp. JES 115]